MRASAVMVLEMLTPACPYNCLCLLSPTVLIILMRAVLVVMTNVRPYYCHLCLPHTVLKESRKDK